MFELSITNVIVGITVLVSLVAFSSYDFFWKLKFLPALINGDKSQWYRFFSYALIHADYLHLFFNMYVLYVFGNLTEDYFGFWFEEKSKFFYTLMYVSAAMTSVVPTFEKHKNDSGYAAVGASGAVSAIVFSAILFQPTAGLGLLFIPFYIPAWIFGLLYLAYSFYMARNGRDNIGHDAHFFGAVFGVMFTILLNFDIARNFIETIHQNYF
jgi:membrane associated rhomboid family serine protease